MRAVGSLFIATGLASLAVAAPAFAAPVVRGSVEQVQVTGAPHGARVVLQKRGHRVAARRAGRLGGVVFRHVRPGAGYRVKVAGARMPLAWYACAMVNSYKSVMIAGILFSCAIDATHLILCVRRRTRIAQRNRTKVRYKVNI